MDAGNMLEPMLARRELRMVGATTLDEYRKHIKKDVAPRTCCFLRAWRTVVRLGLRFFRL
jgi:hypothetical protein